MHGNFDANMRQSILMLYKIIVYFSIFGLHTLKILGSISVIDVKTPLEIP